MSCLARQITQQPWSVSSLVEPSCFPVDQADPSLGPDVVSVWECLTAVQGVLLRQREERFHGGIIVGRTDPAHGANHVVLVQCMRELAGTKLAAPVAVDDAPIHIASAGYRIVECGHGRGSFSCGC